MPRYLRQIAWSCIVASLITGAVLLFGPQEGLETLAGGLLLVFTLFYHGLVGPAFIWHGFKAHPLSVGYILFMFYMVVMWGIGIHLYVTQNDLDDAASDFIESRTEPANFQIREIGEKLYMSQVMSRNLSADDRALWHQFGREATDVNRRDESRNPALFYAAAIGDVEMIDILIEKGAVTDDEELYYRSPLSIAVENGHQETVSRLIEAGADINQGSNKHRSSLVEAASKKDIEMVRLLIDAGADPNMGSPAPFSIALREGDVEIVSSLLDAGAEPLVYFRSMFPIEVALENEDHEMVDLLLAKTDGVNAVAEQRNPLLFQAFYDCDLDRFQRYLELGADTEVVDQKGFALIDRMSYFRSDHCDFDRPRERFVEMLIEADADLNLLDKKGNSPAIRALWYGQAELAAFLVEKGASIEGLMANKDFLMVAAGKGDITMIDQGLARGLDINRRTEGLNGSSPILEAARGGHTETVQYLVSRGARIPTDPSELNMLFTHAGKDPAMARFLLERYVQLPAEQRNDERVIWGINSGRVDESKAMLKEFNID